MKSSHLTKVEKHCFKVTFPNCSPTTLFAFLLPPPPHTPAARWVVQSRILVTSGVDYLSLGPSSSYSTRPFPRQPGRDATLLGLNRPPPPPHAIGFLHFPSASAPHLPGALNSIGESVLTDPTGSWTCRSPSLSGTDRVASSGLIWRPGSSGSSPRARRPGGRWRRTAGAIVRHGGRDERGGNEGSTREPGRTLYPPSHARPHCTPGVQEAGLRATILASLCKPIIRDIEMSDSAEKPLNMKRSRRLGRPIYQKR